MDNELINSGVTLSEEAALATRQLIAESAENQFKPLRLYLDGKGCDGFFYGVSFDERLDGDHEFIHDDQITIVVDDDTLEFVQGATINWVDDERGRGYLVDNPSHKKYRGKFFKRPKWHSSRQQRKEEQSSPNGDETPAELS